MTDAQTTILDELLVLRCREGSPELLQSLLERWQGPLQRHARRLTGRDDAADDVLQETLLSIAGGIGRLDDPATFRKWAYTITTRRAMDWLRRNGRGPKTVDVDTVAVVDERDETTIAADVQTVREALGRLPGDRQVILALRYQEAFATWQIAEILGVPEGTVKSRLHHARAELRDLIERMDR